MCYAALMIKRPNSVELLRFYVEAGVDEAIGPSPVDRTRVMARAASQSTPSGPQPGVRSGAQIGAPAGAQSPSATSPPFPLASRNEIVKSARMLAAEATTLADLKRALERFEGCALRLTATNTVFGDGNPQAPVMFVGEAPGAEEDRQGLPFVGDSGKLLDRMLAAIGLDRDSAYITNVLPWRPPGNRSPTAAEIASCLPFVERHIELVAPEILVMVGGIAAKALLGKTEGIMKLRGRWFNFETAGMVRPIPATATFHPAYLLRSPAQKRESWRDFLEIKERLSAIGQG